MQINLSKELHHHKTKTRKHTHTLDRSQQTATPHELYKECPVLYLFIVFAFPVTFRPGVTHSLVGGLAEMFLNKPILVAQRHSLLTSPRSSFPSLPLLPSRRWHGMAIQAKDSIELGGEMMRGSKGHEHFG